MNFVRAAISPIRTLRGRLLVLLLGVSVTGLLSMGIASVALLHHSLMTKLDDRLVGMSSAIEHGLPQPPPGTSPPDGLPTDFRVVFFDSEGHVLGVSGQTRSDPGGPVLNGLNHSLHRPHTVPDRADGSAWRIRTTHLPNGTTIAVALSLTNVAQPVHQLIVIETIVGAIVLAVLALMTAATVQLGMRPLARIETTARAIADGELDRRVQDQDPATETGRLGAALNTMLSRLVTALQQREHSEQRLRRFVADASHELRTPLTSIRGFAELYRHSHNTTDDETHRAMSRIENEAIRMGRLVEDLLLLARLDRERSIELADIDLAALAGDVVHDARARDASREITLTTNAPGPRVLGDTHRLRQVLDNLLTNALRHTIPGSPVQVTASHGAASDNAAAAGTPAPNRRPMGIIEIADQGPGIPPEHAQRIFDRFYRVHNGSDHGSGTGLGLAITAAIAEAHNGRIELSPNSHGGSTFRLLVPLS